MCFPWKFWPRIKVSTSTKYVCTYSFKIFRNIFFFVKSISHNSLFLISVKSIVFKIYHAFKILIKGKRFQFFLKAIILHIIKYLSYKKMECISNSFIYLFHQLSDQLVYTMYLLHDHLRRFLQNCMALLVHIKSTLQHLKKSWKIIFFFRENQK